MYYHEFITMHLNYIYSELHEILKNVMSMIFVWGGGGLGVGRDEVNGLKIKMAPRPHNLPILVYNLQKIFFEKHLRWT